MNVQELGIDQCEVKVLMQEAATKDHGWLDSTGQQLMLHTPYMAPTGPPLGYNVILIGGPMPGSSPSCRKALLWPPNSPSQSGVLAETVEASVPLPNAPPVQAMVVQNLMADAEPVVHASSDMAAGGGIADEIRKLTTLHEQGALTDAEFAQAKGKLLAQL